MADKTLAPSLSPLHPPREPRKSSACPGKMFLGGRKHWRFLCSGQSVNEL